MYGIWLQYMGDVGKYSIHGAFGQGKYIIRIDAMRTAKKKIRPDDY